MQFKKVLITLMLIMLSLSVIGCDDGFYHGTQITTDANKTQLYVGNFDGGLGHDWLEQVIIEFEKENPTVQVIINNEKDLFSDANLLSNMQNYNNDVYFLNGITYKNYVVQNKLADITDIVTKDITGETQSIEDKMNPTLKDYYQTADDKYFAVPFFDSIFGLVYDVDLFEEEGFYFNTNNKLIAYDGNNKTKSAGPNKIVGDYDDGLPATKSQWNELVTNMKLFGITPYTWTGYYDYYRMRYLTSIWADYEGKDNFDLNFSFNGNYQFLNTSQTFPFTLPGLIYAASETWTKTEDYQQVETWLETNVFHENPVLASVIRQIGSYSELESRYMSNGTMTFRSWLFAGLYEKDTLEQQFNTYLLELKKVKLESNAVNDILNLTKKMNEILQQISSDYADEIRLSIKFIQISVLINDMVNNQNNHYDECLSLINAIEKDYPVIWLKRNKYSGLDRSSYRIKKIKELLINCFK